MATLPWVTVVPVSRDEPPLVSALPQPLNEALVADTVRALFARCDGGVWAAAVVPGDADVFDPQLRNILPELMDPVRRKPVHASYAATELRAAHTRAGRLLNERASMAFCAEIYGPVAVFQRSKTALGPQPTPAPRALWIYDKYIENLEGFLGNGDVRTVPGSGGRDAPRQLTPGGDWICVETIAAVRQKFPAGTLEQPPARPIGVPAVLVPADPCVDMTQVLLPFIAVGNEFTISAHDAPAHVSAGTVDTDLAPPRCALGPLVERVIPSSDRVQLCEALGPQFSETLIVSGTGLLLLRPSWATLYWGASAYLSAPGSIRVHGLSAQEPRTVPSAAPDAPPAQPMMQCATSVAEWLPSDAIRPAADAFVVRGHANAPLNPRATRMLEDGKTTDPVYGDAVVFAAVVNSTRHECVLRNTPIVAALALMCGQVTEAELFRVSPDDPDAAAAAAAPPLTTIDLSRAGDVDALINCVWGNLRARDALASRYTARTGDGAAGDGGGPSDDGATDDRGARANDPPSKEDVAQIMAHGARLRGPDGTWWATA